MTRRQAIAFVRTHGVVLESAKGPVPSLAVEIAGGPIRGGWWGHPRGHAIFAATRDVRDSEDVLVCRLVGGKITYVHRRLWPALVRLAGKFSKSALARVREEHTASGEHAVHTTPFPKWVPAPVRAAARRLTPEAAEALLKIRPARS